MILGDGTAIARLLHVRRHRKLAAAQSAPDGRSISAVKTRNVDRLPAIETEQVARYKRALGGFRLFSDHCLATKQAVSVAPNRPQSIVWRSERKGGFEKPALPNRIVSNRMADLEGCRRDEMGC